MHILQPKHIKLKPEEVQQLLKKYGISLSQLPVIKSEDSALPEGIAKGDIIKIERKDGDKIVLYYRVVI